MTSISRGPSARVAICEAQRILERQGYSADRVIADHKLYDLIAWHCGRVLLVSVQASRHISKTDYHDHIVALSDMLRQKRDPNLTAEMWIYKQSSWLQWEITQGGAIQKRQVAA